MSALQSYRELPTRDNHMCFACSPINPHGLQMKFLTDGNSLVSILTVPDHLSGWKRLVHGGVISTILDEVMGWCAIYLLKRMVVTKKMTVEFLRPVNTRSELKAEGRVLQLENEREVRVEGVLYNEEGTLCARANGVFTLLSPERASRMDLVDEEALDDFNRIIGA